MELYDQITRHLLLREPAKALVAYHEALLSLFSSAPLSSLREFKSAGVPGSIFRWSTYPPPLIQLLKLGLTLYTSLAYSTTSKELLASLPKGLDSGKRKVVEDAASVLERMNEARGGRAAAAGVEVMIKYAWDHVGKALRKPRTSIKLAMENQHDQAETSFSPPDASIYPPTLVRTLVLASLKMDASMPPSPSAGQSRSSLKASSVARDIAEEWLGSLEEDVFTYWIASRKRKSSKRRTKAMQDSVTSLSSSVHSQSASPSLGDQQRDTLSSDDGVSEEFDRFRKDYIAVIELYLLEILPADGDHDIAAEFLREDAVIGAKAKERIYKRIHAVKEEKEAAESRAQSLASANHESTSPTHSRSRRSSDATESTVKPVAQNIGLYASSPASGSIPTRRGHLTAAGSASQQTLRGLPNFKSVAEALRGDEMDTPTLEKPGNVDTGPASFSQASDEIKEERTEDQLQEKSHNPYRRLGLGNDFSRLRRRLNDFLDTPLTSSADDTTGGGTVPNPPSAFPLASRHRRGGTLNVLSAVQSYMKRRWKSLATLAIILTLLFSRVNRRYRRMAGRSPSSVVGAVASPFSMVWTILQLLVKRDTWIQTALMGWEKLRNVVIMGLTITYV